MGSHNDANLQPDSADNQDFELKEYPVSPKATTLEIPEVDGTRQVIVNIHVR